MLPNTREIAVQLAILHELYPKETISELANRLLLSPVFIINALDEGEKMELFTRDKKKDVLIATTPVNYSNMMGQEVGAENIRIQNEILRVIVSANEDEMDVEEGTLRLWLRGIKPSEGDIALHILTQLGFIAKYELRNPKDPKSKYWFYTSKLNVGKDWGVKQFKKTTTKKKK